MASETRVQCEHGWRKEGEECWRCVRDTQTAQPDSAQEEDQFGLVDDELVEVMCEALHGEDDWNDDDRFNAIFRINTRRSMRRVLEVVRCHPPQPMEVREWMMYPHTGMNDMAAIEKYGEHSADGCAAGWAKSQLHPGIHVREVQPVDAQGDGHE